MANTPRVEVRCYRYSCPECGAGDDEMGHLATGDELHCFVCLIEDDRTVRLRRWLPDEPAKV